MRPAKKAYAMIVVLILMMILVSASYIYARIFMGELTIAKNNRSSLIGFSLAEAGVQEAIYKIQYNTEAQEKFIHSNDGNTIFTHDPALVTGGAYTVTIQNSAPGVATINSIATYQIGLRTARREINVSVAQATTPQYTEPGAIFSSPAGGESTGDLEFSNAVLNIYGGGIISGRDIRLQDTTATIEGYTKAVRNITDNGSTVNCSCLIEDDGDPLTPQCAENPGCAYQFGQASEMPMVDFDSEYANSYKQQAISQNQYYESANEFFAATDFIADSTKTFSGVVFIEGGFTLDGNRTMIINGTVVASGTITIGQTGNGLTKNGTMTINNPGDDFASGILSTHDITVNSQGNLSGTGLIYSGTKVDIGGSSNAVNITGGILSRRVVVTDRTVTVHFDSSIINNTLDNPNETPVIEINHWEEEY